MVSRVVCIRKYNKEEYRFYLNEPEYKGEKGIFGYEIEPYVSVETPENCFGYSDTVLISNGVAYTQHRYLPRWILKKIQDKMIQIMNDYNAGKYYHN